MTTTIFICQLDSDIREEIEKRIKTFLSEEGYEGEEAEEIFETAMSGRLCDLEDCIKISDLVLTD